MKRTLQLLLIFLLALPASARRQRTQTSGRLKPVTNAAAELGSVAVVPDSDAVVLSGYDKTNAATCESFFVTNASDTLTLLRLYLTFDYYDMAGRQLHSRSESVSCLIPAGDTRQLTITSWDRQHSFHYYLSRSPQRKASEPFRVTSHVDSVLYEKKSVTLRR